MKFNKDFYVDKINYFELLGLDCNDMKEILTNLDMTDSEKKDRLDKVIDQTIQYEKTQETLPSSGICFPKGTTYEEYKACIGKILYEKEEDNHIFYKPDDLFSMLFLQAKNSITIIDENIDYFLSNIIEKYSRDLKINILIKNKAFAFNDFFPKKFKFFTIKEKIENRFLIDNSRFFITNSLYGLQFKISFLLEIKTEFLKKDFINDTKKLMQ